MMTILLTLALAALCPDVNADGYCDTALEFGQIEGDACMLAAEPEVLPVGTVPVELLEAESEQGNAESPERADIIRRNNAIQWPRGFGE